MTLNYQIEKEIHRAVWPRDTASNGYFFLLTDGQRIAWAFPSKYPYPNLCCKQSLKEKIAVAEGIAEGQLFNFLSDIFSELFNAA